MCDSHSYCFFPAPNCMLCVLTSSHVVLMDFAEAASVQSKHLAFGKALKGPCTIK